MTGEEYMKQCVDPNVGIMLTGYQLGALNTSEAERFQAHLLECDCCRLELERSESAMSLLRKHRVEVLNALQGEGISFDSAKEKLIASYRQLKSNPETHGQNVIVNLRNLFKKNPAAFDKEPNGAGGFSWKWLLAPVGAVVVVLAVSVILFSHKTVLTPEAGTSAGNQMVNQKPHSGNPSQPSESMFDRLVGYFRSVASATPDSGNHSPSRDLRLPGDAEHPLTSNAPAAVTPHNISSGSPTNPDIGNPNKVNSALVNPQTADSDYTLRHRSVTKNYTSSNPAPPDSNDIDKPGNTAAAAIAGEIGDILKKIEKMKRRLTDRYDYNRDSKK
jgi:hypothetical protein